MPTANKQGNKSFFLKKAQNSLNPHHFIISHGFVNVDSEENVTTSRWSWALFPLLLYGLMAFQGHIFTEAGRLLHR